MRWNQFVKACPEIGSLAEGRFRRDQLVMLGTLRADGSPRISPCEIDFGSGQLFLGIMWRSKKALDLLRDPRLVIHSVTCNKEGTDGDVKLYGRADEVQDVQVRAAYREAIHSRINWAPEEPNYHVFTFDLQSASYMVFGPERRVVTWEPTEGLRERPFPEAE
jgi:Pyridoxamine 5'-phosphate oxidase